MTFVRLIDPKRLKLGIRITTCVFLKYAKEKTTYRFIYIYIYVENKVIFELGNALFHEEKLKIVGSSRSRQYIFFELVLLLL